MKFDEIATLERVERELNEALEYELLNDRAYTGHFRTLEKRWCIVHRTIKKLKKLQAVVTSQESR